MPYPPQIDADTILYTAREMIAEHGVDKLSLNKLAKEMGVKAPSLYRYYSSKAALLRAINEDTSFRLFDALSPSLHKANTQPFDKALEAARLYRRFASENPAVYGMLFTNTIDDLRPDPETNVRLVLPYQELMAKICGETNALMALRGFLSLIHGYVMLELSQQLRRGGDLNAAYEASVRAYLQGWSYA
jgi:AcrR family transcriptional regulator